MDELWQKISGMTKEQIEQRLINLHHIDRWTQENFCESQLLIDRLRALQRNTI